MKETGLLFTPENYDKVASGLKTQTRRMLRRQPGKFVHIEYDNSKGWQYWWDVGVSGMADVRQEYAPLKCPFGTVGDRLYVKEGLAHVGADIIYRRDKQPVRPLFHGRFIWKWQRDTLSPLHMPKWAARLWLELVVVGVERVQDISEEDALAEGVNRIHHGDGAYYYSAFRNEPHPKNWVSASDAFKELWVLIHGPGSWERNDWVWVLSYKTVQI